MSKDILIYFSHAKENYVDGEIKNLKVGNTKYLADQMGACLGIPAIEIIPRDIYPDDYEECIKKAKQELKLNARPEVLPVDLTIEAGDHVYLGFPNWWGTMPMCVWTFLEQYPLRMCRIHPFCTHEGGFFGHSIEDLHKLCPNATIHDGLCIEGSKVKESTDLIFKWLKTK